MGRGTDTLFFLDYWVANQPLRQQFPSLFAISDQPSISMALAVADGGSSLSFRRLFGPDETPEWNLLVGIIAGTVLSNLPVATAWRLAPLGIFSTKSLYDRLAAGHGPEELTEIWKARLPPNIKIFLWQLVRGRLPSGGQVQKRHGPGSGMCPLCEIEEDLNHIFFYCVSAQFLWA